MRLTLSRVRRRLEDYLGLSLYEIQKQLKLFAHKMLVIKKYQYIKPVFSSVGFLV